MAKTKIFVFGDSHTRALSKAAAQYYSDDSLYEYSIHWMLTIKNEKQRGDLSIEDACESIKKLAGNDILAISLLGTTHNIIGLVKHNQPYWLFEPGSTKDEINPADEIIPRNAIWDMFERRTGTSKRIEILKKCSSVRVFHIMPPPPKEDNEFISSKTSRYRDNNVADTGIAPPELRLRLWKIELQVLDKICKEWGITLLPPPIETLDDNGFLKQEFYAEDATHANSEYGALILKQLEEASLNGLPHD